MQKCIFEIKIGDLISFFKCLKRMSKKIIFSCNKNNVIFGNINDVSDISVCAHVMSSQLIGNSFDFEIDLYKLFNIFDIYRTGSKETSNLVQIMIIKNEYIYNLSFIENVSNGESKYQVKRSLDELIEDNLSQINIRNQIIPSFVKKIRAPVVIILKILNDMSENYNDITMVVTNTSIILYNDTYSAEIFDPTILSNANNDIQIILNIKKLTSILETSNKFIDIYFTNDNFIFIMNNYDTYSFRFYMSGLI